MEHFDDLYIVTLHHLFKLVAGDPATRDRPAAQLERRRRLLKFVGLICRFVVWFNHAYGGAGDGSGSSSSGGGTIGTQNSGQGAAQGLMLTVRDALSWLSFVAKMSTQPQDTDQNYNAAAPAPAARTAPANTGHVIKPSRRGNGRSQHVCGNSDDDEEDHDDHDHDNGGDDHHDHHNDGDRGDTNTDNDLQEWSAYVHGAGMAVLDGLGLGSGKSQQETDPIKSAVSAFLSAQVRANAPRAFARLPALARAVLRHDDARRTEPDGSPRASDVKGDNNRGTSRDSGDTATDDHDRNSDSNGADIHSPDGSGLVLHSDEERFCIGPFSVARGTKQRSQAAAGGGGGSYAFGAATTTDNVVRIMRAMQLNRPLLLEGSPGVGKTSVVLALARVSGHAVTRINLSEQTDMADLLGSDLPAPSPVTTGDGNDCSSGVGGGVAGSSSDGGGGGRYDSATTTVNAMSAMERFRWCNGPLLKALMNGDWVILDELNLASQTVLEGLNSLLDHRSEVRVCVRMGDGSAGACGCGF
jgi:hypothetical protein